MVPKSAYSASLSSVPTQDYRQAILDSIPEAIVTLDNEGLVTYFNRGAESAFGYTALEILGRSFRSLIHSELYSTRHSRHPSVDLEILESEFRETSRAQAIHKNGMIFPVELSVSQSCIRGETGYVAVVRDISKSLKGEEALRRERDFVERLFETSQVLIKVLDGEGRILRFNPYLEKFCGYDEAEVCGRDWFSLFIPGAEQDKMRAMFELTLKGIETREFVNTVAAKDGSLHVVEWRASTLRNSPGEVVGVFSIGVDITDRVRAERELLELHRLAQQQERLADLGAIAAEIVHDVGNPLAALSMQAQLVRKRVREQPSMPVSTVERPVERLVSELHRLESLVREFMNFARYQRLDVQRVQLSRFLSDVVTLWASVASARGIDMILEPPSEALFLKGDNDKLVRVFDNLVKNALEAIDRGPGRVVICARSAGAKVRISIEDSGPGIPSGVQLFRLFETTKNHGTGLGLPIARQIIIAHGGSIRCEALTPNGTAFHIELPLDQASVLV